MDSYKIILVFFLIFFISCGNSKQGKDMEKFNATNDKFYTSSKDGDIFRIPLIKPIQIISTVGYGDSWVLKLPYQHKEITESIEVDSAYVIDSLIIIYSKSTYLPGEMTQVWLLIDTKNQLEFVYRNYNEYQMKLNKMSITSPKLYDINELYTLFKKKGNMLFK